MAIKPLEGLKVLDATSNIAGPYGGAILADLGAEVIKIEVPAGDPSRSMAPIDGDKSAYFNIVNRNKAVREINLKSADGMAELNTLLESADIFLTNFLPDRLTALHLTPDELMNKYNGRFGYLTQDGAPEMLCRAVAEGCGIKPGTIHSIADNILNSFDCS